MPIGLEVVWRVLRRDLDIDDPYIPLRLWWAVEHHATTNAEAVAARFARPDAWRSGMTRDVIQPRLIRRLAAEGTSQGDAACARLLASAPSDKDAQILITALDDATHGRRAGETSPALKHAILDRFAERPTDAAMIRLAARFGSREAIEQAEAIAAGKTDGADASQRLAMIDLLGELRDPTTIDLLLRLATGEAPAPIATAALNALGRFEAERIARTLLDAYLQRNASWRGHARDILFSRSAWVRAFLDAIDARRIDPSEVPLEQVRRIASLGETELDKRVHKHWGQLTATTPEVKLAEVRRLNNDLNARPGDPSRGRLLFREHCAPCHQLHGEGQAIGPDLTHANRQDRQFLLVSLVDPSGVIRKEYQATIVETRDGRVLNGLIAEQTPTHLTLVNANGERHDHPS